MVYLLGTMYTIGIFFVTNIFFGIVYRRKQIYASIHIGIKPEVNPRLNVRFLWYGLKYLNQFDSGMKRFFILIGALLTGGLVITLTGLVPQVAEAGVKFN